MKRFLFAVTVALAAATFAAGDTPPQQQTGQPPANNPGTLGRSDDADARNDLPRTDPIVGAPAEVTPSAQDIEALAKLHHDNEMEIQLGQLAKKKARSKQVKSFGDLLIKDHTLADKQLTTLAKRKNIDLTMPEPQSEAEAAELQEKMDGMSRLEALEGDEFDREFTTMMVKEHQAAIDLVEQTLGQTQDAKIHTLLNKLLPVLKEHRRVAESISKRVQSV